LHLGHYHGLQLDQTNNSITAATQPMGYIQEAQSKWGKFWKGQRHFIVMGMTGSGKTTFISHLAAKKTGIKLGHGLASSELSVTNLLQVLQ